MPFDMFKDLLEDIKDSPLSALFEKGEELRRRFTRLIIVIFAIFCVVFYFSVELIAIIKIPLLQSLPVTKSNVYFKDPLEGFMVMLKVSLLVSIVVTLPILLWEIMRFVESSIPDDHKKLVKPYFFSALVLFFGGSGFCYFVVVPSALSFLVEMGSEVAEPMLLIGDYISVLGWMLLGFGVVFQLPLVLVLLGQLGIIDAATLRKTRSYSIIINLIVAAILTPTPDPFSQLAMAIPMCILYELSIFIISHLEKKQSALTSSSHSPS
jgi:sec-independent protein translocase protein TatC